MSRRNAWALCFLCITLVCHSRWKSFIERPEGFPVWQRRCVECLGCLHICPVKAIDLGEVTKGRSRYRHKEIKSAELLRPGMK